MSRWISRAVAGATLGLMACASSGRAPDPGRAALKEARRDLDARRYEDAYDRLRQARALASTHDVKADQAMLLGECLLGLDRPEAATDAFYRAQSLGPRTDRDRYRIARGMARAATKLRQPTSVRRHLEEAVRIAPDARLRDNARFDLIDNLVTAGDTQRAQSELGRIVDRARPEYARLDGKIRQARPRPIVVDHTPIHRQPRVDPKPVVVQTPRRTAPDTSRPEVIGRIQWGAESPAAWRNLRNLGNPDRITVHHGGEHQAPPTSRAAAAQKMRSYQSSHQGERGWADIGYHFVIDGAGRVWEGRSLRYQGAHAGSPRANRRNIGVCLMGNFDSSAPGWKQKKALESLLGWLSREHGIEADRIQGHDEVRQMFTGSGTSCPGRYLASYLSEIKTRLGSRDWRAM